MSDLLDRLVALRDDVFAASDDPYYASKARDTFNEAIEQIYLAWELERKLDEQKRINKFDLTVPIAEMREKMKAQDQFVARLRNLAQKLYEALTFEMQIYTKSEIAPTTRAALARYEQEVGE